jgi:uncharacterized repeat protein (TIGR03803 family)
MKFAQITAHGVARATRLTTSTRRQGAWRSIALMSAAVFGLAVGVSPPAQAQTFTVLYSFAGYPTDGGRPAAGLFMDAAGDLYGTTAYGGNNKSCPGSGIGCGTVFKLDTNGVETVLHNFTGADGANPRASLIMGADASLYGTTAFGGNLQDCGGNGFAGCGVVFKLSGQKETVLHRFTGGTDGAWPVGGVLMGTRGALYGSTNAGGTVGGGVVFKLVGKKETVLHSFTGGKDGNYLTSGLLMDIMGNLYGTDAFGGDIDCGCGVVFKLTRKQLTVLHSFKGPPDGATPVAGVIMDAEGNLYGTTREGGESDGAGTVFELSSNGKERVLHRFRAYTKQHDGIYPVTPLVRDAQGNLYGATVEGGLYGAGVVYEITAAGKEKILHSFCSGDCSDGAQPNDLIMDTQGNLYGTTSAGGGASHDGTVFKITLQPSDAE